MAPALELPRSVLLALWLQGGSGHGAAGVVEGDDEPHDVVGGRYYDLGELIEDLAEQHYDVAAVLPAPGDPLVGPPDAPAAGECVLVHNNDEGWNLGIVPEIHRFGSRLEPGATVAWHAHEIEDWRAALLGVMGSLDDAERDLREGLLLATRALVDLDVARWRPDAAERIAAARDGSLPADRLPAEFKAWPQRVRVMTQAARLRAIVALAAEDEGGAVNLWQADQRSTALREVDRLARRAMTAAASWLQGDEVRRYAAERRERRWRDEGQRGS
jgi:hypothetical protein